MAPVVTALWTPQLTPKLVAAKGVAAIGAAKVVAATGAAIGAADHWLTPAVAVDHWVPGHWANCAPGQVGCANVAGPAVKAVGELITRGSTAAALAAIATIETNFMVHRPTVKPESRQVGEF